jgi:hypothetical protein
VISPMSRRMRPKLQGLAGLRRTLGLLVLGVALVPCAACGAARESQGRAASGEMGQRVTLRIFDPAGHIPTQVSLAGISRRQTRVTHVDNLPTATLSLVFTKAGRTQFCGLTRALAHRGSLRRHRQSALLEVNGRVIAHPYVDYRAFPKGLCVPALSVQMKLAAARRLAHLLRSR